MIPDFLEANTHLCTNASLQRKLARQGSCPLYLMCLIPRGGQHKVAARANARTIRQEKWQNFNSLGPGNSESAGEGEEREEGTGEPEKYPETVWREKGCNHCNCT